MFREDALLAEFRQLKEDGTDPQARGLALEGIVAKLFRRARFGVDQDPRAARPRQTDLVATSGSETYLIETKWRANAADVGDLDELRARLGRATPGAIGVLISIGGFAKTVIDDLSEHRDRLILLIDADELEKAISGSTDLKGMLSEKRDAMRVHGEVIVESHRQRRPSQRRALQSDPAPGDAYIVLSDGSRPAWFVAGGRFGHFTFARNVTDPDWVPAPGAAVSVDIRLPVGGVDDIVHVLAELSALRFSTGDAHWCIQQSSTNWHGTGAKSLVEALERWEERYQGIDDLHHTEEVCYQDVCDDGFYTLTFDVAASDDRRVWHADLSMQLIGVPLDQDPIRELCRTFKVEQSVHFRPRTEKVLKVSPLRHRISSPLEVLAFIVEDQERDEPDREWVAGIIVKNPLFRPNGSVAYTSEDTDLDRYLAHTEVLVCELSSWHPLDTNERSYGLRGCEWGWTSNALVVRISADWDR
jgi:Restriction endonuclease